MNKHCARAPSRVFISRLRTDTCPRSSHRRTLGHQRLDSVGVEQQVVASKRALSLVAATFTQSERLQVLCRHRRRVGVVAVCGVLVGWRCVAHHAGIRIIICVGAWSPLVLCPCDRIGHFSGASTWRRVVSSPRCGRLLERGAGVLSMANQSHKQAGVSWRRPFPPITALYHTLRAAGYTYLALLQQPLRFSREPVHDGWRATRWLFVVAATIPISQSLRGQIHPAAIG